MSDLLIADADGIQRITMNRPDKRKALTRAMYAGMTGPEGPPVAPEEAATGRPVEPPTALSSAGTPLRPEEVRVLPGPGAGRATRARFGGEAQHG
jgi:hypothetical protein